MTLTATSIFAEFRDVTEAIHRRTLEHPTVQGIGAGTLSEERFRYYIEQDYQYLLRYIIVQSIAATSAPDLGSTSQLSRLVASTIDLEIDGLRDLYQRFGGDPHQLDTVEPSPTCLAYTNHLLAIAREGDLFVTLAGILPCQWGYHDIALHLRDAGMPDDSRFRAWIEDYVSEEYGELVSWAIDRFNTLGAAATTDQRQRARSAWERSSQYEILFWEMAWNREAWPKLAKIG